MTSPNSACKNLEPRLSPTEHAGLELLTNARRQASAYGIDIWQFAVELKYLEAIGLTLTDLRQFIAAGVIAHAQELPNVAGTRRFRTLTGLAMPSDTCFVLTDDGAKLATGACGRAKAWQAIGRVAAGGSPMPVWAADVRTLYYGGRVVKRFRQMAVNQELILSAFQEDDWPGKIDDPLPGKAGLDPRQRLRETVRALNRNQDYPVLRFAGDGTGAGVLWVRVEPDGRK